MLKDPIKGLIQRDQGQGNVVSRLIVGHCRSLNGIIIAVILTKFP